MCFRRRGTASAAPEVQLLLDQGFEIKILRGDDQFGVMHNKIAIFDGQVLETGSYNWTHAADTWHWENATFHAEQARIKAYQAYWNWMWSISLNIPSKAPRTHDAGRAGSTPPRPVARASRFRAPGPVQRLGIPGPGLLSRRSDRASRARDRRLDDVDRPGQFLVHLHSSARRPAAREGTT